MSELAHKVLSDIKKEYGIRISEGQEPEEACNFEHIDFSKKYGYDTKVLSEVLKELKKQGSITLYITDDFVLEEVD